MENYSTYYLFPSAIYSAQKPTKITTILGSCVAVCLWDPILKYGGMNHYMLPLWNGVGLASPKFGSIAIEKLLQRLLNYGSQKKNIVAKVFGGAEVLGQTNNIYHIGLKNIDIAYTILEEYHIRIISEHVGGRNGRKIIFDTYTSQVNMKLINNNLRS